MCHVGMSHVGVAACGHMRAWHVGMDACGSCIACGCGRVWIMCDHVCVARGYMHMWLILTLRSGVNLLEVLGAKLNAGCKVM